MKAYNVEYVKDPNQEVLNFIIGKATDVFLVRQAWFFKLLDSAQLQIKQKFGITWQSTERRIFQF